MLRLPNLLWIVTTQWRAQALGSAGDPNARTPNLDALARRGVLYAQAVTPHPFGPWARAALLTGVTSPANGVRAYFDPLPAGAFTLASALNARGYATAYFGKWHLGRRDPAAPLVGDVHARTVVPVAERGGFDFWEGFESGFLLNDPWLHGSRLPEPVQVCGYQSDVLAERVVRTEFGLDAGRARGRPPWGCVLSLEAPHPPYDAPSAGVRPRPPGEIVLPANVPRGGDVESKARRELAGYYAHIEATDRAIGRVLAHVNFDDTVVVFTSVHGDMHGAHGLFRKGWPHEESVRVPLLVSTPGGPAGVVSAEPVSLLDVMPWSIRWADGAAPETMAAGGFARLSMPAVVNLPWQCDRTWRAVRTPRRKLVVDAEGAPWFFHDLENDPLEMNNLAADAGARAEMDALRAWL